MLEKPRIAVTVGILASRTVGQYIGDQTTESRLSFEVLLLSLPGLHEHGGIAAIIIQNDKRRIGFAPGNIQPQLIIANIQPGTDGRRTTTGNQVSGELRQAGGIDRRTGGGCEKKKQQAYS